MRSSGVRRRHKASEQGRPLLPSVVVGLGLWLGFPSAVAYQDMTSLIVDQQASARWAAVIEQSKVGSVHKAEMAFNNPDAPGALSGAGISTAGIGDVAFRTKGRTSAIPDEERVNQSGKQGRLVKTLPMAPPRLFNAGSILQHSEAILSPSWMGEEAMAFAKPEIKGKEVQIATAFHARKQIAPNVPSVIADLVNNEKADVLATAYAPPEPDYSKASPFASILREENAGRFIPPVSPSDHAWARKPLPPAAFSDREQQCLAAGIYFEARGESVEGQAAVGQVVLNRVRNPAYPNTICGVVYQNKNWRNRCQFSFACDGIRDRVHSRNHFDVAKEVAMATTAGKIWLTAVGSSTHYHATYVHPRWASTMERMGKIGQHIFYRTYGGGWD